MSPTLVLMDQDLRNIVCVHVHIIIVDAFIIGIIVSIRLLVGTS